MTTAELLDLLHEAQQLLNHATNIEDRKRVRLRRANLDAELARCTGLALHAHEQASKQLQALERILEQAASEVEAVRLAATGDGTRPGENPIYEQITLAVADMWEAHQTALQEMEDNRQRLGTFSITLFGRTMTGKSTLMEILTEGSGDTIGKGAQRATRDTRQYEWNGLKILDVPGVAAFGGSIDERVAYEAAQQADLILFLISDDAPQPAEAEHLAELRRTGNPVLGICNVKMAVNGELGMRRFLKNQHSLFDEDKLNNLLSPLKKQLSRLGFSQPMEFKCTHLLSRFLADQPEYRDQQVELHAASRFGDIEDHIYREVTVNGSFHRQRSFLESTSRVSFDIWRQMLIAGASSWELHDRIRDHAKETRTWRDEFRKEAELRIQGVLNSTIGRLRASIPAFVEANCEDRELAQKWAQRVEHAGINREVRKLQQDLKQRVVDKIYTLTQELDQELQGVQVTMNQPDLITGPIADHRKRWNWSARGISSALTIASLATGVMSPPGIALGIAAMAVGIIGEIVGRLFGNKAERRQEAIARITPELQRHLDQIQSDIKGQLDSWLLHDLIERHLDTTVAQLETSAAYLGQAAVFYRSQSASLNQRLLSLNRQLLEAALKHIFEGLATSENLVIARVPGQGITLKASGIDLITAEAIEQLQLVIQEPVHVIPAEWTTEQVILWGTGREISLTDIRIDWDRAIAHAPHEDEDPATAARISMAQQLTGLHIRNSK